MSVQMKEMAYSSPSLSSSSSSSCTLSGPPEGIPLWAYMPCRKDQPGSRIRRYVLARDEVLHNEFILYEERPQKKAFDRGVLVLVYIDADTPEEKWKGAVRQRAYNRLDAAIQREKKKMDILDGVDGFPKSSHIEDDRATV